MSTREEYRQMAWEMIHEDPSLLKTAYFHEVGKVSYVSGETIEAGAVQISGTDISFDSETGTISSVTTDLSSIPVKMNSYVFLYGSENSENTGVYQALTRTSQEIMFYMPQFVDESSGRDVSVYGPFTKIQGVQDTWKSNELNDLIQSTDIKMLFAGLDITWNILATNVAIYNGKRSEVIAPTTDPAEALYTVGLRKG